MPKNDANDNPLLRPMVAGILDNPLAPEESMELMISPCQELEQKIDMLTEIDSIATITKQQLSIRRQRVELEVENKKLDTAKKTIDSIEKIINAVSSADVLERVTKSINTALDMKLMAEAAERLTNTLKNLMGPNVMDDLGNKKHLKINRMFRNSDGSTRSSLSVHSDGDRMTIAHADASGQELIQIDSSDE